MHQGDIFNAQEQLTFKTTESKAAVISKKFGRKILSPKAGSQSKATLLPPMNNISSRPGKLTANVDIERYFSGTYLVLDRGGVQISSDIFPMSDDGFFFVRYTYKDEVINKKLNYSGDTLFLDKSVIFKVDGNPLDPSLAGDMELNYLKGGNMQTTIGSFKLVCPSTEALKKELMIIKSELTDSKNLKQEVKSYLNEYYGKPGDANLSEWMADHLN